MVDVFASLRGLAAANLVHHRGSMLFLDTLVEVCEQGATCEWLVREECELMVAKQGVPGYASLECMAQCIAAHAGAMARTKGQAPPLGLLLGTRQFRCEVEWLIPGHRYLAECVELIRDEQGLASFDCRMMEQGRTISTCRLTVYEKEAGTRLEEWTALND